MENEEKNDASSSKPSESILEAPSTTGETVTTFKIAPIAVNFGREDLDQLAMKLNEVVVFINSTCPK